MKTPAEKRAYNRKYMRGYYATDPEYAKAAKERAVVWNKRHTKRRKEIRDKWRAANRAKIATQRAEYRERKNAASRRYRAADLEKGRRASLKCKWKKRGIDVDALPPKPEHCEVCHMNKRLCLDHNHETGAFRGWLCVRCNAGIGNLHDDPALLRKAIAYLKRGK